MAVCENASACIKITSYLKFNSTKIEHFKFKDKIGKMKKLRHPFLAVFHF